MRRRDFIVGFAGSAAAWPLTTGAQQGERMRRIATLTGGSESDAEFRERYATLRQELQGLGWIEGRNLRFDSRWGSTGDIDLARRHAAELVALAPDVVVTGGTPNVAALQQASRAVPIVFVGVVDPVGAGLVASLARPGGNTTGFISFEYGMSAKWLELLKEINPRVTRAAVVRDPTNPASLGLMAAMQGVAPSLRVELSVIDSRAVSEIEGAVEAFARGASDAGLIITLTGSTIKHRSLISTLAARHRLPAVYPVNFFVTEGGLISYGPDTIDQFRRAAGYVDRILKGEKPADLPVQAPTKYELMINLKTAKALGIDVPPTLLARADEVIE